MGSTSSKASRVLPKRPPSWAGARTPQAHEQQQPQPGLGVRGPRASETKDAAIERDAQDPHLLANLKALGQVRVDHHMQSVRTANVRSVYQSLAQSEADAAGAHTPRNRLWGYSLSSLLEERQAVTSPSELKLLADKYNVDVDKLENVARYVNFPSVMEGSHRKEYDSAGNERIVMTAEWREPVIVSTAQRIGSG
ncbi:hypothetical protein OF83DRAFT_317838 [Amylostereum chailletii]|nr:hypothetical protein OF83DRAFT_317838 [Amylostereum chailletii]